MTPGPRSHNSLGQTVVVVDDEPLILTLIEQITSAIPGTHINGFTDPGEALAWCGEHSPDVVITDYSMPGLSGLELVREVRRLEHARDIPIMMITAVADRDVRLQALEAGANDFVSKPIDASELRARTRNMLAIRHGQCAQAERAELLEAKVREATATIAAREYETTLRLARAAEYRDGETGAHIVRVSCYGRIIAKGLGLPEHEQELLYRAAPMHDVGKIGVPDYILLKPSALDDGEFEIMKQHTVIGHRILGGSSSELLQMAADIALSHHERLDGSGYPHQLSGEDIPLCARVTAVADTFDALTSERPYKKEWPTALAWEYLVQHSGKRFDTACVDAFRRAQAEVAETRASFPDHHGSKQAGPAAFSVPA